MYNLRMLVICPRCQAENEDVARFCNQCGNALENSLPENKTMAAAPAIAEDAPRTSAINWSALVIIALVIAAIWYVVGGGPPDPAKTTGAAGGAAMPQEVLDQVAALKDQLKEDPANIEALRSMYETYGMVGKVSEVTPYAEAALEYMKANKDAVSPEEQGDRLLALFIACYENRDEAICLTILEQYHLSFPDNLRILKVLGDLSYDNTLFEQAAKYYEEFIDREDPETDLENYLNAMTDLGSCYIQLSLTEDSGTEMLDKALATFDSALEFNPQFWQAHFNRGVALGKLERLDDAVTEWEWCKANTVNEMEKWRAGFAIAELRGEEPPAMPGNPHSEGFGEMGMGNPHSEGMPNPHGEAAAPPLDGDNLPPNPHSEEFLRQQQEQSQTDSATDG
jgi:tetratricopeptide (TPR) repeat protein